MSSKYFCPGCGAEVVAVSVKDDTTYDERNGQPIPKIITRYICPNKPLFDLFGKHSSFRTRNWPTPGGRDE